VKLRDEAEESADESAWDLEKQDPNLRSTVLQRIRLDIVSGATKPGAIFSVPTLAKKLGTSTTPVREALLELSASGLIEPLRNRGFRVVEPSLADLRDLFALRVQLEVFALTTVAAAGLKDTAELSRLAKAIAHAAQTGNTHAYLAADRAYHRKLISFAGNRRLTEMVMHLRDNMRLYGMDSPAGIKRQNNSIDEHFQLIELLESGQSAAAVRLLTHHILDWEPVFSAEISRSAGAAAAAEVGGVPGVA